MRLISQRVHMNKCNCRESRPVTLDRDFNVPDARPDAISIMKEQGDIRIEEVRLVDDRASVRGQLEFQILYAAEGDCPVSEMSGSIPFDEMIPLPCAGRDDELRVQAELEDLRGELINSRKIGLKAMISMEVTAETVQDSEGAVDIEDADQVYVRKKDVDISRLVFSGKDTLRVHDEWKVPGTKDAIGKILYSEVRLGEMESRLAENELLIDGMAQVFVIYAGDGDPVELNCFDTTMPISGSIACNGCDATMTAQVMPHLHSRDIEIKMDEDGEPRILDVEVVAGFDIKVYGQETLSLLTDFYSTKEVCTPVYEESQFENLIIQNKSKARISGRIPTGNKTPLQIWNVSGELRIDHKEIKDNMIVVEGAAEVNVLCYTGDSQILLTSFKGTVPFEHTIEAEGVTPESNVWMQGTLDQISAAPAGENELEIKAAATLEIIAFEKIELSIISGFDCHEIDWKARSREPGMIGYVVQPGEGLWDIAKQFFTTENDIIQVNHLENETVAEGDVLLLLRQG